MRVPISAAMGASIVTGMRVPISAVMGASIGGAGMRVLRLELGEQGSSGGAVDPQQHGLSFLQHNGSNHLGLWTR